MARQQKTEDRIAIAREVLSAYHPMTVRQVYYQLVSRQVIENKRTAYQAVSDMLVAARREGIIPWDWIEDRLRRPTMWAAYSNLSAFLTSVKYRYQGEVWTTQPQNVEVWLEKDALSGIFSDVLGRYRVTLNVGRGYDGWSSIYRAAQRFKEHAAEGRLTQIVYFGDFDPSGEDMARSLKERLSDLGCGEVIIDKVALTYADIQRYNLPPDFAKKTDTRAAAHIAKHGDVSVELDALPANVLSQRIRSEVEARMDLTALKAALDQEMEDQARLAQLIDDLDVAM